MAENSILHQNILIDEMNVLNVLIDETTRGCQNIRNTIFGAWPLDDTHTTADIFHIIRKTPLIMGWDFLFSQNSLSSSRSGLTKILEAFLSGSGPCWHDCIFSGALFMQRISSETLPHLDSGPVTVRSLSVRSRSALSSPAVTCCCVSSTRSSELRLTGCFFYITVQNHSDHTFMSPSFWPFSALDVCHTIGWLVYCWNQ